jgi:hypothetical protein
MRILEKLKRIAFRPFDRSEHLDDGERTVENTDALAATGGKAGRPELDDAGPRGAAGLRQAGRRPPAALTAAS